MKQNINTQAQIERNDRLAIAYLAYSMTLPEDPETMYQDIYREHDANEDFRLAS